MKVDKSGLKLGSTCLTHLSKRTIRESISAILRADGSSAAGIHKDNYKVILRLKINTHNAFKLNSMNCLRLFLAQLYSNLLILRLTPVKIALRFPDVDEPRKWNTPAPDAITLDVILNTGYTLKLANTLYTLPAMLELIKNDFTAAFNVPMIGKWKEETVKEYMHIFNIHLDFDRRE